MRAFASIAVVAAVTLAAPLARAADKKPPVDKLTMEDRIELTRGLMAEYANAKVLLPRSKKALEFDATTATFDKKAWTLIAKENGPAARTGDTIQITKIELEADRIVLQLNGGYKGGRHWYDSVQMGGGMGGNPNTVPVNPNSDVNAPGGTSIAIDFHKPLEPIKAAAIKKMLAPVLDFDRHSVTEVYSQTLPPEVQKAIQDKHVIVGMDHEQVIMAMGHPVYHLRETKDGMELEDWIYGQAPGKITFITFNGDKVIKVKDDYAGLGTQVDPIKK
ncbi:MAG: hypothetical protein ABSH40_02605 [Bryobacteraceae bacterium]|jgi:hypothetical protein